MKLFKKNRNKLVPTICRNCGTQTHGRYCHICGQDIFVGRKSSVWNMVYSFLENSIAFDRKIPKTYFFLFFRPGLLSLEYIRGRIVQYIRPTKLLWFIIFIFFAITSINLFSLDEDSKKAAIEELQKEKEEAKNESDLKTIDTVLKNFDRSIYFEQVVKSTLPYVAFLYIPCFTLLMYIFFRNKQRFYANHLIFSTHLYSFLFLLMLIYYLVDYLYPKDFSYPLWLVAIMLAIPTSYYMIAIRVFYKAKYVGVILKGGLALILNLILLLLVFIAYAIILGLLFLADNPDIKVG